MHLHLCVQKAEFLCTQHNTKRGDQKVVSFRIMIISPSYGKQEVEVLLTEAPRYFYHSFGVGHYNG